MDPNRLYEEILSFGIPSQPSSLNAAAIPTFSRTPSMVRPEQLAKLPNVVLE